MVFWLKAWCRTVQTLPLKVSTIFVLTSVILRENKELGIFVLRLRFPTRLAHLQRHIHEMKFWKKLRAHGDGQHNLGGLKSAAIILMVKQWFGAKEIESLM